MNDAAAKRPSRRLWLLWLGALAAAVLIWLAAICVGIVGEALRQEVRPADAIVVFGAAEYSGRPSPVYRARLDHAFDLFEQGVAPVVITTGGAAADPSFSEGGVGHDYLMHRGIPDSSLIEETHGSDTAQSAERIGVIMRANHLHSCVAVSDAYHVFRIRKLLEHEGMQVYVSPRPDSRPHSLWQRAGAVLREALSYMVWRVQGLA
ncbi:MAG: YdcF family protein [Terriglobales bacterium]|jgi:uncharacterized SAM-binding protein YcdF (DUF218 family)